MKLIKWFHPKSFVVAAVDITAPVATCPADVTATVELGTTSVGVTFPDATATDDSGNVTLISRSHTSGMEFSVGNTTVVFNFSDPSGNVASCEFTVSIDTGRLLTGTLHCIEPSS